MTFDTLILTPLSKDFAKYKFAEILKKWKNNFDDGTKPKPQFVFAIADTAEAELKEHLKILSSKFEVSTVPVPYDALVKNYPMIQAEWLTNRFGEIALFRNMLLDEARRRHPDMAIFLDADVVPPVYMLDFFHEDFTTIPHVNVCGGIVKTFNNNWDVVYGFGDFKQPWFSGLDWAQKVPSMRLAKVGFANTACLALKWRIIDDDALKFEALPLKFNGEPMVMSEDHSFSHLLSCYGYKIFIDNRVRCDHLRITPSGFRWLTA